MPSRGPSRLRDFLCSSFRPLSALRPCSVVSRHFRGPNTTRCPQLDQVLSDKQIHPLDKTPYIRFFLWVYLNTEVRFHLVTPRVHSSSSAPLRCTIVLDSASAAINFLSPMSTIWLNTRKFLRVDIHAQFHPPSPLTRQGGTDGVAELHRDDSYDGGRLYDAIKLIAQQDLCAMAHTKVKATMALTMRPLHRCGCCEGRE